MNKVYLIFIFWILVSYDMIGQTVTSASVSSSGWKRIAHLPGTSGRGFGRVSLSTTGGDFKPVHIHIDWFHDWSSIAGVSVHSDSKDSPYWSAVRITHDGSTRYIEVNFIHSLAGLRLISDDYGWNPAVLYSGSLTNGGGTVRAIASVGRLNIEDSFLVNYNGNVGIGTTTPIHRLEVNGTVRAKEVKLEATNWPDYVFSEAYRLPSLEETEAYIKTHGHLPGFKSAGEYETDGVNMLELNQKLLEKVEETLLYTIRQQHLIEEQQKAHKQQSELIEKQQYELERLKDRMERLENGLSHDGQ